jgi:hypothetical protein
MKLLLALFAVFTFTASAADVSGTWKAVTDGPNGTIETILKLKVDGDKLSGTIDNQFLSECLIENGKIDTDNISFVVKAENNGAPMTINFKGKVASGGIQFTVTVAERDRTVRMTAKRVS